MDCPVCAQQDISPLATFCPHCGSDLVQFALLDDLEEEYVETVKEKIALGGDLIEQEKVHQREMSEVRQRFNRLVWLLFLLPFLVFICGRKSVPTAAPVLQGAPIDSLNHYKKLYHEAHKAMGAEYIDSIRYVIRKGDKLGMLGEMFFGNYDTWQRIKIENNIKDEHRLMPGDTLTLRLRMRK
jgi:hypothetical protein